MAFDDNQNDNNNNNDSDKNQNSNNQNDNSDQSSGNKNQHNQVFLVAGERAFGDAEAVVKKIESADSHIITLEAERKADRERLVAQDEELVRLRKIEESLDGRNSSGKDDQTDRMSIDEIAAHAAQLAVGKIAQNKTVEEQNRNLASAEAKAATAYGEDYVGKISEIAKGLNMTLKAVDELSKSSPDAFARLFLPTDPGQSHQPTHSSLQAPNGNEDQQSNSEPVNIVKLRERDRIALVGSKMKEAGVPGY